MLRASSGFDWGKLVALAEHHRVEGLVAVNLMAHSAEMPDAIRDHFAKRLRRQALHSLALTRATVEVTNALRDEKIPCILLKGDAVAARFYRSQDARQCIDVDVLVAEQDSLRARSIVEALGFAQSFPGFAIPPRCEDVFGVLAGDIGYRRPSDGVRLELHWRLQSNPNELNWDFDTVRSLATEMSLAGTGVPVLEPPPQMVYLICHGAKHAWFRLKWLADICRVAPALTDEQAREVVCLSQRSGVLRMLATSLRLLTIVYGIPAQRFAGDDIARHEDRDLLNHMIVCLESETLDQGVRLAGLGRLLRDFRYRMNLRTDVRYRLSVAVRLLADVRDIQTIRLSKRWLWLYVLLGPVLRATRVFKREIKARSPSY